MARSAGKQIVFLGVAISLGATRSAFAETCTYDTDCTELGTACGTDVCSWAVTPHTCVAAVTQDPGYCQSTADCKCAFQGATCKGMHCTFTVLNEDDGGPFPIVPEEAGASDTGASEAGAADAASEEASALDAAESEAGALDATATQEAGGTSAGGGPSADASGSEVDAALSGGWNQGGPSSSSVACTAGAGSRAGGDVALAFLGGCVVLARWRKRNATVR